MVLCSQGVSYSGFLWDSSSGIDLKDAAVLESPVVNGNGNHTYPRLYMAHFFVSNDLFQNPCLVVFRWGMLVNISGRYCPFHENADNMLSWPNFEMTTNWSDQPGLKMNSIIVTFFSLIYFHMKIHCTYTYTIKNTMQEQ